MVQQQNIKLHRDKFCTLTNYRQILIFRPADGTSQFTYGGASPKTTNSYFLIFEPLDIPPQPQQIILLDPNYSPKQFHGPWIQIRAGIKLKIQLHRKSTLRGARKTWTQYVPTSNTKIQSTHLCLVPPSLPQPTVKLHIKLLINYY